MLVLNVALVAGLAAVGAGAHSRGVLAEGGDYLLDAAGAGLALLAIRLPGPAERWDGWSRAPFTSESRQHVSVGEKPLPGDQRGDDVADLHGGQGPGGIAHG